MKVPNSSLYRKGVHISQRGSNGVRQVYNMLITERLAPVLNAVVTEKWSRERESINLLMRPSSMYFSRVGAELTICQKPMGLTVST